MSNVTVKVLNAVVDGKTAGSILEIDEQSAQHLASIRYVEIIKAEKPANDEKGTSAPKKSPAKRRKKSE